MQLVEVERARTMWMNVLERDSKHRNHDDDYWNIRPGRSSRFDRIDNHACAYNNVRRH